MVLSNVEESTHLIFKISESRSVFIKFFSTPVFFVFGHGIGLEQN